MVMMRGQEVHPGTVWVWRDPSALWSIATCSFCGSIKAEDTIKFLVAGNDASGSDWKNNWPHKFYVRGNDGIMWKFYNEHLTELDSVVFQSITDLFESVFKVRFEYDVVGRIKFRAPSFGYQTWRSSGRALDSAQLDLLYENEADDE